ncbi:DHB4 enzyme, partial [Polypterus senegalus]
MFIEMITINQRTVTYQVVSMPRDGTCLFHFLCYILHGHIRLTLDIRRNIVSYVLNDWYRFKVWTDDDTGDNYTTKEHYKSEMLKPFTYGSAYLVESFKAEYVAPVVLWLCHESCKENGSVFEPTYCGGRLGAVPNWDAKKDRERDYASPGPREGSRPVRWERTQGRIVRKKNEPMTPEAVQEKWEEICDFENAVKPQNIQDSVGILVDVLAKIDKEQDVSANKTSAFAYKHSDINPSILYALGVGMSTKEPDHLKFLYERHEEFSCFPTFGVIPSQASMMNGGLSDIPGLQIDMSRGTVKPPNRAPDAVVTDVTSQDQEPPGSASVAGACWFAGLRQHSGSREGCEGGDAAARKALATARLPASTPPPQKGSQDGRGPKSLPLTGTRLDGVSCVPADDCREAGPGMSITGRGDPLGGGEGPQEVAAPEADSQVGSASVNFLSLPAALAELRRPFSPPGSVCYRCYVPSGLRCWYWRGRRRGAENVRSTTDGRDAGISSREDGGGGFDKPILHGLCSFGYAARHVLKQYADNDILKFKAIKVRFMKPVIPGQSLQTEMWQEGSRIHFQMKVKETNQIVLGDSYVDLCDVPVTSPSKKQQKALQSDLIFAEIGRRIKDVGKELVKKVNAVFQWEITKDGITASQWTIDLKNGSGSLYKGLAQNKADVTFSLSDEDFMEVVHGKLNPQKAFFAGKLKVKGNIMLSQKLETILKDYAKL